jgi:hypothetical protein
MEGIVVHFFFSSWSEINAFSISEWYSFLTILKAAWAGWGANPESFDFVYFLIPSLYR